MCPRWEQSARSYASPEPHGTFSSSSLMPQIRHLCSDQGSSSRVLWIEEDGDPGRSPPPLSSAPLPASTCLQELDRSRPGGISDAGSRRLSSMDGRPFGAEAQGLTQMTDVAREGLGSENRLPAAVCSSSFLPNVRPRPQEPGLSWKGPSSRPGLEEAGDALWPSESPAPPDVHGAAGAAEGAIEPTVIAVNRQDVFPDTWGPAQASGQQRTSGQGHGHPPQAKKELDLEGTPRRGGPGAGSVRSLAPSPEQAPEAGRDEPELPLIEETPSMERISTSGQMRSVIRRSRETGHAHPMSREPSPRRRLGPSGLHKTPSQDQLIAELQGRLGIRPEEEGVDEAGADPEAWLTEGVIITVQPRGRRDGGQIIEKVVFPPDSPIPLRRTVSVPASPPPSPSLQCLRQPLESGSPSPPAPPSPGPPRVRDTPREGEGPSAAPGPVPREPSVSSPLRPPAAGRLTTSVGCQTDEDPLFPPVQVLVGTSAGPSPRGPELPAAPAFPEFMAQGKVGSSSPPGGPPKPGSQLDSMLGSLQSDLNKLGVATVAKGVCGACKKPIAGQVVTAMGKTWHPEHFVCTHCQEEIGSRNFFERDGQPYCEKDYHNLFSPRCHYCNGPILDKVVTALDRTWHPEHFFCAQCGAFFGPEGFHEKDGKAYCRKDYFDMFAPKCGGCARAILENYISALNTLWHPECFVCRECFTLFGNGSFFEHDGQPYCEVHYHERRGSLCSGCQKPITGRCITAMAKKFHPEHFVCAFCLKQLNKGTFKEQNDKPYCQKCFTKLFC
ncbi:paxillin [Gracilinanus agilis]|uniref:paxillin n=1 Tax=Gracilinanus agilis TaxID=191870 RepID=UPI001CFE4F7C|nr:paxillin [Gracilinanus agilis]